VYSGKPENKHDNEEATRKIPPNNRLTDLIFRFIQRTQVIKVMLKMNWSILLQT